MDYSELVNGVNNNDHAAFRKLFDSHYAMIVFKLLKASLDKQEAEDAAIIIFHKFFSIRNKNFENITAIRAYLQVSVNNAIKNHIRSLANRKSNYTDPLLPVHENEMFDIEYELYHPLLDAIKEEIEKFPKQMRDISKLVFLEGMKGDAAAKILGLPYTAVHQQKWLAMKRLKKLFTNKTKPK